MVTERLWAVSAHRTRNRHTTPPARVDCRSIAFEVGHSSCADCQPKPLPEPEPKLELGEAAPQRRGRRRSDQAECQQALAHTTKGASTASTTSTPVLTHSDDYSNRPSSLGIQRRWLARVAREEFAPPTEAPKENTEEEVQPAQHVVLRRFIGLARSAMAMVCCDLTCGVSMRYSKH